jgi:broad specificity phosphatase PhoE
MLPTRRIYIRHADKEYANGDADINKHDPGITDNGVEKSKMVAKHLVEQWGQPNLIIVSPYRRTRETATIMNNTLETPVRMYIDTNLSEYLGNHRNVPIDVTDSTLIHDPPHPETFRDMKIRVRYHHKKIVEYTRKLSVGVVWVVTHGLIIKQIAGIIGIKMAKEFPTLTCLSIVDEREFTKGELLLFHNDFDNPDNSNDSDSVEEIAPSNM